MLDRSWWVSEMLAQPNGYALLLGWIVWVILSITLHELGHGIAAVAQGDDTPKKLGHMTLNPMTHMGAMSLIMFALVGVAWGAMPVNPINFRWGRWGDVVVSAAGPAVNLVLAVAALTGAGLLLAYGSPGSKTMSDLILVLWIGGQLNVALLVMNLLPIPPLDGSRILSGLSRSVAAFYFAPWSRQIAGAVLIVILLWGGGYIFGVGDAVSDWYVSTLLGMLPG